MDLGPGGKRCDSDVYGGDAAAGVVGHGSGDRRAIGLGKNRDRAQEQKSEIDAFHCGTPFRDAPVQGW
jgi:hypothetical protein